jgi:hypothetical protein
MPGQRSRMNQTNREQVLSSDLNRIGKLSAMEGQNAERNRQVRADFYAPASTPAFDDFSAGAKGTNSEVISRLNQAPSLQGTAGTFDMSLGAGEGELATLSVITDESPYQLVRWSAQALSWPVAGQPDAGNPRICLVTAMPGDNLSDLQSRNILTDPATRAVSPQNCYKTSSPLATISVVAGTAGANPLPPAVPSGALCLFEVWVPAGASDSTTFVPVRRCWRGIEFPGTSQHGILKDCVPTMLSPSTVGLPIAGRIHRLVIDGELLTFGGNSLLLRRNDTSHPPTTAPANNDAPFYLYLCGGRNQPAQDGTYMATSRVPVMLIASATPPDAMGYPTATLSLASPAITFPQRACCYIGVLFYSAGTTGVVPAFYDDDWIYAAQTVGATAGSRRAFVEPLQTGLLTTTSLTLASLPAPSSAGLIWAGTAGSGTSFLFETGNLVLGLNAATQSQPFDSPAYLARGSMTALTVTVAASTTFRAAPMGYNMMVPRIGR